MGAEMTEGWWKSAWPGSQSPPSFKAMKQAIKDAKARERGLSVIDYRQSLLLIQMVVSDLRDEAKTQFRKAPIDLKRANKALDDISKVIADKVARANVDATSVVVYSKDFDKAFKNGVKAQKKRADAFPTVMVELELMQALVDELRAKNAEAMLNIACNKLFDRHLGAACKLWDDFSEVRGGVFSAEDMRTIGQNLDRILVDLRTDILKVPKDVMRKIGLDARVSREYKLDAGIKIAVGTVGTGLAVAGAILPGTLPFAIVLAIRSGASLVKEIGTLASTVETKRAAFDGYMKALQAMFRDAQATSGKMGKAEKVKELTLSTLNTVLGVDVLPTIRKARNDFNAIEGNLASMSVRAQKFQGKFAEAVELATELGKAVDKGLGDVGRKKFKFDPAKAFSEKLLDQAHALVERVNTNDDAVERLRKLMGELDDPGLGVERAQRVIDLIIATAFTAGGVTDASLTADVAATSVSAVGAFTEVGNQMKEYR